MTRLLLKTIVVPTALALLWLSLIVPVWSGQNQQDGNITLPEVGATAPDFTLKDFKGKDFTLSKLKDKKTVLLWFTNLCGGCQSKFGEMGKIKNLYEKKGVEIVVVSILGKDRKTVEDIIRRKKAAFRFLYDPQGNVTKLFSGEAVPNTCPLQNIFIISKNGKIVYADHYPGVDEAGITTLLDKVTKGGVK